MGSPQATADAPRPCDEISERVQSQRPWALLIDDGELGDFERALEDLGATTLRLAGETVANRWRQPQRLLVISDRRALTVGRPTAQEEDHFLTMVVLQKPSRTLRSKLVQLGFDYVVRRPVDPRALRLLLRNALYRDREQRAKPRFPVGCEASFRLGWRRRPAVLVELSQSGCSLRVSGRVKARGRIKVHLPDLLTGGEPLALHGAVVRCERRLGHSDSGIISVRFERRANTGGSVVAILRELRTGPPSLTEAVGDVVTG
jgi:hypothetical protein